MAKPTLWVVGDSWSYGWAGIEHPSATTGSHPKFDHTLCDRLASLLDYHLVNHSEPGASMGSISDRFFNGVSCEFKPGDMVFVCVPPDIRWHIAEERSIHAVSLNDESPQSREFMHSVLQANNFNLYWFTFHLNVFLQAIAGNCEQHGVEVYFQHNYGTFEFLPWFPKKYFLDHRHSMWNWIGLPTVNTFDTDRDGPDALDLDPAAIQLANDVLIVNEHGYIDLHPNEKSHRVLGRLLHSKILSKRREKK